MRNPTKYTLQETIGWEEFEDICCSYLYINGYKNIKKAGKTKDKGRDAVTLFNKKEDIVFQFSKEKKPLYGKSSKFSKEYKKWQGRTGVKKFIFVSNQDLGSKKIDLEKTLNKPCVQIFDITDLVNFLDYEPSGQKVKKNYAIFEKDLQEIFGADNKLGKLDEVAGVVNKDDNYKIATILADKDALKVKGAVFSMSAGRATQYFIPKSKKHFEKAIPSGSFKIAFPKTKAGKELLKKYQEMVKKGDSVSIPPEYISELQLRLGSKLIFDGGGEKVSVSFKTVEKDKPIPHILRSKRKPGISIPIKLYVTKSGTDEVTFDNYREYSPLEIKIVYKIALKKVKFSYSFQPERCLDANDAFIYLRLLNEFNESPLEFFFDDKGIERPLMDIPCSGKLSLPKNYLSLLEKIARIQQTFKIRIPNPLNKQLTNPDLWSVEKLDEIARTGKTTISVKKLSFCMNNEAVEKMEQTQQINKPVAMSFGYKEGFGTFSILGIPISPNLELIIPKGKIVNKQVIDGEKTQLEVEVVENAYLTRHG